MQTKYKEEQQAVLLKNLTLVSSAWKQFCGALNSGNAGTVIQQLNVVVV